MAETVWTCKEEFGHVCENLPADKEHEGKRYCVLHLPSADKDIAEHNKAVGEKLKKKDYDFSGTYFPDAVRLAHPGPNTTFEGVISFSRATFEGTVNFSGVTFERAANFRGATFKNNANCIEVTFKARADFAQACFEGTVAQINATFEGEADFSGATFKDEANFSNASFKDGADFSHAEFEGTVAQSKATFEGGADFFGATFKDYANFQEATFKKRANFVCAKFEKNGDFPRANFKEEAIFWSLQTSSQTSFSFEAAFMEKPERVSFQSTRLRPSWFINVDAQKFDFSDVEWFRLPDEDELTLKKKSRPLKLGATGHPEAYAYYKKLVGSS